MKKVANKMIGIIIILLVLIGMIIFFVAGFKKDTSYQVGKRIEVFLPKGYDKEVVTQIATESFPNRNIVFEEIEKLGQVAGIRLNNYSEEELSTFKSKIAETYEIAEEDLTVEEVTVPAIKITTAVEPYIFPTVIVTLLSCIYLLFRNLKAEDKWIKILKILAILVVVLSIYFSIILIARIPFGDCTMPVALAIYLFTLLKSVTK